MKNLINDTLLIIITAAIMIGLFSAFYPEIPTSNVLAVIIIVAMIFSVGLKSGWRRWRGRKERK